MPMDTKDLGLITVLLKRFEKERLPRALSLKEKVNDGHILNQDDIKFLEFVMEDSQQVLGLVKKHPEYLSLAHQAITLYMDIMAKSQENNKGK